MGSVGYCRLLCPARGRGASLRSSRPRDAGGRGPALCCGGGGASVPGSLPGRGRTDAAFLPRRCRGVRSGGVRGISGALPRNQRRTPAPVGKKQKSKGSPSYTGLPLLFYRNRDTHNGRAGMTCGTRSGGFVSDVAPGVFRRSVMSAPCAPFSLIQAFFPHPGRPAGRGAARYHLRRSPLRQTPRRTVLPSQSSQPSLVRRSLPLPSHADPHPPLR